MKNNFSLTLPYSTLKVKPRFPQNSEEKGEELRKLFKILKGKKYLILDDLDEIDEIERPTVSNTKEVDVPPASRRRLLEEVQQILGYGVEQKMLDNWISLVKRKVTKVSKSPLFLL